MAVDSPGWQSVLNTTIPMYIRQETVNILRQRALLAMMEAKGRILMNQGGTKYDWKVEYKRAPMTDFADGDLLIFNRIERHKTAQVPNDRGYVIPEMMSKIDKLQNSGNEAIIKLWDTKAKTLMGDIRENFCSQLYIDGNATGNTKKIMGIETFLGAAAAAVAPGFVRPTDTYADLVTTPGNYGGVYTNGTWPAGSSETPQYDFWSPILVDTVSPVAGAYPGISTLTWANTCNQALRKVITKCRKSKSLDGKLDMIMLEDTLFEQFKNAQDNRTQLRIEGANSLMLLKLGFDVIEFDGVPLLTEYGMPFNTGYAFNTQQMELRSMQNELFSSDGPLYDENTQTWRWVVGFAGNTIWNPKFFGKLYPYNQA